VGAQDALAATTDCSYTGDSTCTYAEIDDYQVPLH